MKGWFCTWCEVFNNTWHRSCWACGETRRQVELQDNKEADVRKPEYDVIMMTRGGSRFPAEGGAIASRAQMSYYDIRCHINHFEKDWGKGSNSAFVGPDGDTVYKWCASYRSERGVRLVETMWIKRIK